MKKIMLSASILLLTQNVYAGNIDKVIYGKDNRLDIFETKNELHKKWAESTAAMVPNNLVEENQDNIIIKGGTLEGEGICSDEKFAKQQVSAMCSGFLVGKDLLVTAGHCIENMGDCEGNSWVFDFGYSTEERKTFEINKKDVYRCSKIISRSKDNATWNDYALIKLDRVSDRSPLTVRKKGKIKEAGNNLVVIGHPSGLPTKISDDASVRTNSNKYYFQANLDTFGGNSGSAVMNTETGIVEGILVRGEKDYEYDSYSSCYRPKVCNMDDCRGEDVTRITNIKELGK